MRLGTYSFITDLLVGGRVPGGLSVVQVESGDSCKRAGSTSSKLPNNGRSHYPPVVIRKQDDGEPERDLRTDRPVLWDKQPSLSSCISGRPSESNLCPTSTCVPMWIRNVRPVPVVKSQANVLLFACEDGEGTRYAAVSREEGRPSMVAMRTRSATEPAFIFAIT